MSQAMRKITGNIGKSGCTVIFLNQLRLKIGVTYGNPETTIALKFYASVRLDIRRMQTLSAPPRNTEFVPRSRWPKTRWLLLRIAEFDILPAAASAPWDACWISPRKPVWWSVKVLGTATTATTLAKPRQHHHLA